MEKKSLSQILNQTPCNILTFDPAVNQGTGASGRRYQVELGTNATLTGSRWVSNNDITRCDRKFRKLEIRCCREHQHPAEGPQDPRLSSPAEREVLLNTKELEVNMLQFVQSPTHLSYITLSQPLCNHFK